MHEHTHEHASECSSERGCTQGAHTHTHTHAHARANTRTHTHTQTWRYRAQFATQLCQKLIRTQDIDIVEEQEEPQKGRPQESNQGLVNQKSLSFLDGAPAPDVSLCLAVWSPPCGSVFSSFHVVPSGAQTCCVCVCLLYVCVCVCVCVRL